MEAKLEAEKLLQCVQCVVLLLNLHFLIGTLFLLSRVIYCTSSHLQHVPSSHIGFTPWVFLIVANLDV